MQIAGSFTKILIVLSAFAGGFAFAQIGKDPNLETEITGSLPLTSDLQAKFEELQKKYAPNAMGPYEGSGGQHSGDRVSNIVKAVRSWIPNKTAAACVVDTIDKNMGLSNLQGQSIGGSNSGAVRRAQADLESSACFATLNKAFYEDIRRQSGDSTKTAKMSDEASGDHPPGWLWDLAKKYADGNPRLAMKLIGTCMHDDYSRDELWVDNAKDSPILRFSDDSEVQALKNKLAKSKEDLAAAKDGDEKYYSELQVEAILHQIEIKKRRQARESSKLTCPKGAPAYANKALSSKADISDDFKQRLAKIHGKSSIENLPAKNYHVDQGAVLGCELTKCGLSAAEASFVQDKMAEMYRATRLCSGIRNVQSGNLKKFGDRDIQAVADAASMFDAHSMFKSVFKENGICSFRFYTGPEAPKNPDEPIMPGFMDRVLGRNACSNKEWSDERCEAALKKLRSWQADEAWTRAQQVAGSKFGASACKSSSDIKDLDKTSCDALKNVESRVPPSEAASTEKGDGQK